MKSFLILFDLIFVDRYMYRKVLYEGESGYTMNRKIKVCLVLTSIFGLVGCQKSIELQPKDSIKLEYGQSYNKTLKDYLLLDGLDNKDIETVLEESKIEINKLNVDKPEIGQYEVLIEYDGKQVKSQLVVEDTTAPVFKKTNDIVVEYGDKKFDFSKKIVAEDLQEIKYTYDKRKIDFNKPGKYKLKVTAIDLSGNDTAEEFDVVIKEKKVTPIEDKPIKKEEKPIQNSSSKNDVDKKKYRGTTRDSQLDATCDKILDRIITSSMNERRQANAIYNWVTEHIRYSGTTAINNWVSSAKKSFKTRKGNCVAFCYTSRALFTRLGLDNVVVHGRNDGHLWNMVKVNGSWYHFDTTSGWGARRFLWTTQQMKNYRYQNRKEELRYNWDETQYPVTP